MIKFDNIFPIYTEVTSNPLTICKSIDLRVFDYPFFNEGVENLFSPKLNGSKYRLEDLKDTGTNLLELKGFIFHTSHCGSTLLSRMLNVSPEIRIVSESEAINGLLMSYMLFEIQEDIVVDKLKQIIDAYRQPLGDEKYLIIKMTSWNVFLRKLIKKAYPGKKWIYIDREKEEVVNSLMKSNGGMETWWDHPVDQLRQHFIGKNYKCKSKEDYLNRMVDQHRKFARKYQDRELLPLHYPDFITQFEGKVLPHFELKFSVREISHYKEILTFNSKSMNRVKYVET